MAKKHSLHYKKSIQKKIKLANPMIYTENFLGKLNLNVQKLILNDLKLIPGYVAVFYLGTVFCSKDENVITKCFYQICTHKTRHLATLNVGVVHIKNRVQRLHSRFILCIANVFAFHKLHKTWELNRNLTVFHRRRRRLCWHILHSFAHNPC